MKKITTAWIIHNFALLHALVALSCRLAGWEDELLLTILTMSMAVIICAKKGLSIEFSAASIIVVNILGYFLGNFGARILEMIFQSTYLVHALATTITTEILGWSIVFLIKKFQHEGDSSQSGIPTPYLKWLLLAMVGVFILRLTIVTIPSKGILSEINLLDATSKVLSNTVTLILLICLNFLYIRLIPRITQHWKNTHSAVCLIAFLLATSIVEAMLLENSIQDDSSQRFIVLFLASLLAELTLYCIIYMINYAFNAHSEMQAERGKANMAQYRYMKFKQQVNPHFLFNSLNILDCLVCEEKTEQASEYIHKLAGIYRYMIKSEEEDLVPLKDEMEFVLRYVDLLKVRFPEGFEVKVDVPEECQRRFVLPCSIQLLIENATKHNAVNSEEPLTILITADGESIRIQNNLIPKITKSPSTGLGLKYLKQQYLNLSGKTITITKTEKDYCVILPLL